MSGSVDQAAAVNGVAFVTLTQTERGTLAPTAVKKLRESFAQSREKGALGIFIWVSNSSPSKSTEWCSGQPPPQVSRRGDALQDQVGRFLEEVRCISQPIVALVDGFVGHVGAQILASCDSVIATRNSETQLLPGSEETVCVDRAYHLGLVHHIVEDPQALYAECMRLKERIMQHEDYPNLKSLVRETLLAENYYQGQAPRGGSPATASGFPRAPPPGVVLEASPNVAGAKFAKYEPGQEKSQEGPITPITTVMVCNIPCRITQQNMAAVLDSTGYAGQYNLLYVPVARRSVKSAASNLGYGFINFVAPQVASEFLNTFQGYKFEGTYSSKTCQVRPASVQGLENFVKHFSERSKKHWTRRPMLRLVDPVDGGSGNHDSLPDDEPPRALGKVWSL